VTAVSFDEADPYSRDDVPDFGVYLDDRWQPPWSHAHVMWPDFGVPDDRDALVARLRDLHDRARRSERVELGCLGGHGRTGTALACLAVLSGCSPADAIAWVRGHYCDKAIETDAQAAFVVALGA
jgi:protein-tyrosine phosphatase